jgi:tetratricopeptide (TPR) repeat protein
MERKKYLTLTILLLFGFLSIYASNKTEIYKAYISNDMNLWKKTIDEMNQQKSKSNDFRLELLNYQYGYIAWCIGNKKNEIAETYIELGEKNIQVLEKIGSYGSAVNSYRSAFYGYKIGLNKLKAPFIGPKSVECAKMAMKQDADNPYGYIQYANSQFYMPAVFGGNKKIALDYYTKAKNLMEINHQKIIQDWNYLSLLSMIAKTYTELKDFKQAKTYYEKILKIEPDFLWVKNELYPDLLKMIK